MTNARSSFFLQRTSSLVVLALVWFGAKTKILRVMGGDGTALSPGNGKGGGPKNWYRPAKIIIHYYMLIRCFVGNREKKIERHN